VVDPSNNGSKCPMTVSGLGKGGDVQITCDAPSDSHGFCWYNVQANENNQSLDLCSQGENPSYIFDMRHGSTIEYCRKS
jgi:hypothetical protein